MIVCRQDSQPKLFLRDSSDCYPAFNLTPSEVCSCDYDVMCGFCLDQIRLLHFSNILGVAYFVCSYVVITHNQNDFSVTQVTSTLPSNSLPLKLPLVITIWILSGFLPSLLCENISNFMSTVLPIKITFSKSVW